MALAPDGPLHAEWVCDPRAEVTAPLRDEVRSLLTRWRVPPDVVEDALLVLAELVANVVIHAGTRFRLAVHLDRRLLRVAVDDGRVGAMPPAGNPTGNQISGLRLVNAIALRWGWQEDETRKTVWAEFLV